MGWSLYLPNGWIKWFQWWLIFLWSIQVLRNICPTEKPWNTFLVSIFCCVMSWEHQATKGATCSCSVSSRLSEGNSVMFRSACLSFQSEEVFTEFVFWNLTFPRVVDERPMSKASQNIGPGMWEYGGSWGLNMESYKGRFLVWYYMVLIIFHGFIQASFQLLERGKPYMLLIPCLPFRNLIFRWLESIHKSCKMGPYHRWGPQRPQSWSQWYDGCTWTTNANGTTGCRGKFPCQHGIFWNFCCPFDLYYKGQNSKGFLG